MTAKVPWPTWSASVDNGRSILSHLKRALWRLSGICMPNLSNRIVASNCRPMKPRGVVWNGAGGWLIFSQSRQVNFSRTVRPGLAYRPLAREGAHALGFRRGGARGKLILARRGGEFFEFQLFDQPRRALGALPVQFALEFLDPQLEMRDQRRVTRSTLQAASAGACQVCRFGVTGKAEGHTGRCGG
ncbi:hypothetical protein ACVILL_001060 [Bradyrhizobium sp. USDA 3364]